MHAENTPADGESEGDNMNPLAGWVNFYVIAGSSAGALIGLQFVVITLITELPSLKDAARVGSAFATPDHRSFRSGAAAIGC